MSSAQTTAFAKSPSVTRPQGFGSPFGVLPEWLKPKVDEQADIAAVFRQADLTLVYMNSRGRARLDQEETFGKAPFTLHEMIGVSSGEGISTDAILKVHLFGQWRGPCELRDSWGSPIPAIVVLRHYSAPEDHSQAFLVLEAKLDRPTDLSDQTRLSDRELLHALMDTVPDAVYFKDRASRFLRISRAMAEKFGLNNPRDAIGKTDFDFFSSAHAAPAFETEKRIQATGEPVVELEEKETWSDGRVNWATTTKLPLRNAAGEIVGTFGISRDITAAKQLEAERREMESQIIINGKLESIGRLAAGIAHEINTPTQYLATNLDFLKRSYADLFALITTLQNLLPQSKEETSDGQNLGALFTAAKEQYDLDYLLTEIPTTVKQSIEGLDRISRIVRSLKEFSHPHSISKSKTDLNHLLENAVTVSRHEWKYVAELELKLDPTLPTVPCIPDQIGQVALNLIVNAAHAIGDTLKERKREKGHIVVATGRSEQAVYLEVQDDGTGIPEEMRQKIFEPFFTTKPVGKGTGQGLAMVRTIVETNHKGRIELTSQIGIGTCFRIVLPLQVKNTVTDPGLPVDTGVVAPP